MGVSTFEDKPLHVTMNVVKGHLRFAQTDIVTDFNEFSRSELYVLSVMLWMAIFNFVSVQAKLTGHALA